MVTFRRLSAREWDKVAAIFKQHFQELPPTPLQSVVVVAEEHGQIVGMLTAQYVFHIEPLWVKETHRGRFIIPPLVNKLLECVPDIQYAFSHTEDSRVGKLLKLFGMKELPWRTFRWLRKEQQHERAVRTDSESNRTDEFVQSGL